MSIIDPTTKAHCSVKSHDDLKVRVDELKVTSRPRNALITFGADYQP